MFIFCRDHYHQRSHRRCNLREELRIDLLTSDHRSRNKKLRKHTFSWVNACWDFWAEEWREDATSIINHVEVVVVILINIVVVVVVIIVVIIIIIVIVIVVVVVVVVDIFFCRASGDADPRWRNGFPERHESLSLSSMRKALLVRWIQCRIFPEELFPRLMSPIIMLIIMPIIMLFRLKSVNNYANNINS